MADFRRNPQGNQTYSLKTLQDRHHEIIRLIVLGLKNAEVARRLGIDKQTVSNVRNTPLVQERLAYLRAGRDSSTVDVRKRIEQIAPKAIDLLEHVIDGDVETDVKASDQVRAAIDVLDRAGHKPPQEVHVKKGVIIKYIEEIKERGRRAGIVATAEENEENGEEVNFEPSVSM